MTEGIDLTAFCGLYCGDCIRYKSHAADLAGKLLRELRETQFEKYAEIKGGTEKQLDAVAEFRHYNECCKVLEAIAALQCNIPCRTGGGCSFFSCGILNCCREKGLDGCWQCGVFEDCEKIATLKSVHGDSPQQNLRAINEFGLNNWQEHRSRPYIWLL
ncbi:MAG: DUF3795 domain-containing protein [Dehalococcoidales bacterium]|nr:DUF3795 domain-containing protein [Dehalococcoidales bacterium]